MVPHGELDKEDEDNHYVDIDQEFEEEVMALQIRAAEEVGVP